MRPFFAAWVQMCERLGIDPLALMRVAYSESGLRANAHNPHGDASGLIQFMPATLPGVGWHAGHAAFRALSAEEQLPFVERYYAGRAKYCTSDALCYVATFLPALLPAAHRGGPTHVLCGRHGPLAWAYRANPVLDRVRASGAQGSDGVITVADMAAQLRIACRGRRYDDAVAALKTAIALASAAEPAPTSLPGPRSSGPVVELDGGLSRESATSEAIADAAHEEVTRRWS